MNDIAFENRFDLVIADHANRLFNELALNFGGVGWLWVKAQVWQESRMKATATSAAGAKGLMQLMPMTARELGVVDRFDPVQSIDGGVRYLADQWRHLYEIPDPIERMRFALASYNGGRGYVNFAMVIARDEEGLPGSFKGWRDAGRPSGMFQRWEYTREYLKDPRCRPGGKQADWEQMFDYVEKIEARYRHYFAQATKVPVTQVAHA